jgi:hypothetical protein
MSSFSTPPPPPTSCVSYVDCQEKYIQAIQSVNDSYGVLLAMKDDPTLPTFAIQQQKVATSLQNLNTVINEFNIFLSNNKNSRSSSYSRDDYKKVVAMRQELENQSDMLKSRFGAPKNYGAMDNIYDEYRMNYNSMVYIMILSCLVATVLIYFLFRNL